MADFEETQLLEMSQLCEKMLDRAYCVYSKFPVAAVILTECDKTFTGCNVENASYGLCICAERTAAVKAVSEGFRKFKACFVMTNSPNMIAPCGACRQFLSEFGQNMTLILFNKSCKQIAKYSLHEIFPSISSDLIFGTTSSTPPAQNSIHKGSMRQILDPTAPLITSLQRELEQFRVQDRESQPKGHISWREYFMTVAQLAAKRSKDPSTQVGACIVNRQNKIVATGYNGMPNGVSDNSVPWTKEGPYLDTKYAYVVHAELNAILNSVLTDQTGCTLYVTLFPCNECAKSVIQSGIRHVIYLSDKHAEKDSTRAAKTMFQLAGVLYEQFLPF